MYYLLGFVPASSEPSGRVRRIDVRVDRPGSTVRARDRYSLPDPAPAGAIDRSTQLVRTVAGVLPSRDVPLEAAATPLVAGDGGALLVVGQFDTRSLRATAAIVAGAFTPKGEPVIGRQWTVELPESAASGADVPHRGLALAIPVAPGAYELRLGVAGDNGVGGSVHVFAEVPDFAREPLSMSGILFGISPGGPPLLLDETAGTIPFEPSVRRAFASSDVVSALVQVSQGTRRSVPLRGVTVRVRILNAMGELATQEDLVLQPGTFSADRVANVRLAVPVERLTPGDYLLDLEAIMDDGRATRAARFRVE